MLRSAFIALSQNRPLRNFAENSSMGRRMSSRFVAGMQIDDAVRAAQALNRLGIAVSLDALGENVFTPEEAHLSASLYHRLLDAIHQKQLNANVSVKLTQMGMDIDPALAQSIASDLVDHAAQANTFVRIDMEGTPYTQATVDMTRALHSMPGHHGRVGTVMQAYLHRCESDIQTLLADGIRIRLCKGAYKEPASLAFPRKEDVDANYLKLTRVLLESGIFHGIATHDEAIINQTRTFVAERSIDKASFEFQMLYGIRRDLQKSLVDEGFGMRVYLPFGAEWYPYFMRRLAERPANALFIAKNMIKK